YGASSQRDYVIVELQYGQLTHGFLQNTYSVRGFRVPIIVVEKKLATIGHDRRALVMCIVFDAECPELTHVNMCGFGIAGDFLNVLWEMPLRWFEQHQGAGNFVVPAIILPCFLD